MSEWKWRLIVTGAVLLACSVSYFVGKKQGRTDEMLSTNKNQIHVADSVTRSDSSRADTAKKNSEILVAYRSHVREKIKVVHDTVYSEPDSGSTDLEQVISDNPQIAQLITADDSTIAALKNFVEAQAVVIADQRSAIALRDTRIALLESRGTSRISKGFQIGVGYCQTATSRTPCAYVGYGFQVRLP